MKVFRVILSVLSVLLSVLTMSGNVVPKAANGYFLGGNFYANVYDYQGNLVASGGECAYGLPISDSEVSSRDPYLYGNKMLYTFNGINLYDFEARTYAPDIARFLQPDPKADDYHWLSPYAYCAGDPINFIDPDGRLIDTVWDIGNVTYDVVAAITNHINGDHEAAKEHWLDAGFDLGAALIPGVPAGTSKLVKWAKGADKAADVAKSTAKSVKRTKKIGATGEIGENELKKFGGESQVNLEAKSGRRRIDQLVGRDAHEAKVGYTPCRKSTMTQVKKDAELIETKTIDSSTWHFFKSPETGKIGPSKPLKEALDKYNIKYIIHD